MLRRLTLRARARGLQPTTVKVALAGIFCMSACTPFAGKPAATTPPSPLDSGQPPLTREVAAPTKADVVVRAASTEPLVEIPERDSIVTLQPISEPRYAPPESLKQFRRPCIQSLPTRPHQWSL